MPEKSDELILIASFAESVSKFRGRLISALVAAGTDVVVVAPGIESAPFEGEIRNLGANPEEMEMQRTGMNPVKDLLYLVRLVNLFARRRPNYVLAYTIKPVVYGTLAAWLARVPNRFALVTGLGYAFTGDRQGLVKRIISLLYRAALGRAHKVFFQNPDDEEHFRAMGILPAHVPSVVVNGSGIDVDAYNSQPIPDGPPVFLMIGRLLGDKGVREYAEAARRMRAAFPLARFQLVGWIDENPDAIAQSELDAWVASGTIEFLGKLADVRPAILACTVYVLPSYREGTPRTVLEAMAMGRPVITTDAPGCRETVIDGDNGFLVPVQSVDALEAAMRRFIEDPSLATRMGLRSRVIAETKYDVRKVNAVMLREMGIGQEQEGT